MRYLKLFEEFEDKSILDSDFIVNTLNDLKKEAFADNPTYHHKGDNKIYEKPCPTHEQLTFKWNPKNLMLTIEIKPEREYSYFGLSKEKAQQNLKDDMPMFDERIDWILSEATKRIKEKGITLEEGDDSSHGRSGFEKKGSNNIFPDMIIMNYLLLVFDYNENTSLN